MARMPKLTDPWLIAVWPGMGRVARTAGEFLAASLQMEEVGDLDVEDYFEMEYVTVEQGVAWPGPRPRCPLFIWRDPQQRHDLILLLGEAQPQTGGFELCDQIMAEAKLWGVSRVISFAAMATQMHPTQPARVFGAVTDPPLLEELTERDVEPLTGGQVSGLNGLMLAAAQQHGIDAMCLLGELPFYASQVPNPKASRVVLGVIDHMLGLKLDFTDLDEQAERIDAQLADLVEELQRRAQEEAELDDEEEGEFSIPSVAGTDEEQPSEEPELDPQARRRIEQMFAEAERDRDKAFQLKRELDQHGVFKEYEDRFLDLFKRGE